MLRLHGHVGARVSASPSSSVFGVLRNIFQRKSRRTDGPVRFIRLLAGLLFATIFSWANLAYASPSTECPSTQTMSVVSGGTQTVDLSGCSIFGLDGMPVLPSHGSVPNVDPAVGNGTSLVTYVNNGDGALSDHFTVYDDVNGTIAFTVTIAPAVSALTVTPSSLPAPAISTSYSQNLSTAGGVAPYVYAISSGSLPTGMSLSSAGVISGTPTATGPFTVTVGVHDSTTPTALHTTKTYGLTVAVPTLVLSPASPPGGSVSQAYSQQLSTSGGTAPYSYSIQAGLGTLPPGLSLSSGGLFSGTPTTAGSYTFSVKYTDSSAGGGPFAQAQNMTIVIAATPVVAVNPATLSAATVASAYSQSMTGSGGTGPYTFAITAGALPAGLTLSTAGGLSGTPTAGGTFNFTIKATDQNVVSGTRAYTLSVAAPTVSITPLTLSPATVVSAYSQSVTASGGVAPYTYAISAGALPAGMTLSSAGLLSGTPSAGGTFNFTVSATDSATGSGPYVGSRAYAFTVNAPTISLVPATLPAMTVSSSFSQSVVASGGLAPYTYSITAGAAPTGLTLAANGTLSGTPTAAGAYNFTVTATDSSGGSGPYSGSQAYSGSVALGLPVAGAVSATVGYGSTANPITLNLSGGTATSVAVATAAAHGAATASGVSISYTPVAGYAGSDSFTYTATNLAGTSSAATVTVTVAAPTLTITPSVAWSAVNGNSYTQTLTWSGGAAPYGSYTVSGLPAGLTVTASTSNSATISGAPTAAGSFSVTASAIDSSTGSGPFTKSQTFTFAVTAPTLSLSPAGPTLSPTYGSAYSQVFSASSGVAPYTYVLSGSLPTGLSWNAGSATLSGTPTQSGSFPVTVTATDHSTGAGAPFSTAINYTLVINAPAISLAPSSLSGGTVAQAYSGTVSASGGVAPYTYSITTGALPTGVTLNAATGALSGTPTAAGSFNVTVKALDANNFSGTRAYSLTVGGATLTLTPASLPAAAAETAYSTTLTASGGTAPYSFAVTGGALPGGLTLNSATGVLSGTTNVSGSFNVTIKATDSSTGVGAPFSATRAYTLSVSAPSIAVTPTSLTNGKGNVAYSQQFASSGGVAPYAYTLVSGSLPAGLTLSGTGLLAGTPTTSGSFSFTVRTTDAQSFTGQQALTLVVAQAQPVAVNDVATTQANQAVTVHVTANDSDSGSSVAISTPPTHGSATVSGSDVVYTPANNYFGTDTFSYTDTDAGGTSSPATVTVTVTPLAVPVAVPQNATILAGQPVTVHAANGASGGPFTGVVIVSPPGTGTTVVNGTDIVYTAAAGSSGNIHFSYTLSNAFGASAAVTATISVNPLPMAATHTATVSAGAAVNVDLMAGATGGPFTAAAIVAVAPATAGTAVIHNIGTANAPSYQMTFTAATAFAGAATVNYTLSNAYATSAPGIVTITVVARRDMSTDPEVIGLLAAQADSARRFATAQLSNFTRRLESLHGDGWGQSGFGVSFTPPSGRPTSDVGQWQQDDIDRVTGASLQPNMRKVGWSPQSGLTNQRAGTGFGTGGTVLAANDTQSLISGLPDLPVVQENQRQALSLWTGGAVDFGQQYANGRQAGFKFTTSGLSAGGDYRINDFATIGVGAGFGRDSTDVGNNGTKSTGESVVAAMYGSLRPAKNVFIDGVLGIGTLSFDGTRYITDGGGFANGLRHGDQVFGTIVTGVEYRSDGFMWSPYGRLELMSATLDQYTENAAGLNALTYFKQTVRTTTGTLGVRAEGLYVTSIGTWLPRARLEFRHQFQGADDATLAYADLAAAGPAYLVHTINQDTGNWAAGIGARLLMRNKLTLLIDYSSNINVGNGRSQSIMFGIELPLN